MQEYLCTFGGGYGWEKLFYDDECKQFSVKKYHCGMVDVEDYYDGEFPLDAFTALQELIKHNKLRLVLRYYKELSVKENLDRALASMRQTSRFGSEVVHPNEEFEYYEIENRKFVVYYGGTYFC